MTAAPTLPNVFPAPISPWGYCPVPPTDPRVQDAMRYFGTEWVCVMQNAAGQWRGYVLLDGKVEEF